MSGSLVVVITLVTAGDISSHVVSLRVEIVGRLAVVNYVGLEEGVSGEFELLDFILYH